MAVSFICGGNQSTQRENHGAVASHWQTWSHTFVMLYLVHHAWAEFKLTILVMISTDCTGTCKSNYHTITTTTPPLNLWIYSGWEESQKINQLLMSRLRFKVKSLWPSKIHCHENSSVHAIINSTFKFNLH